MYVNRHCVVAEVGEDGTSLKTVHDPYPKGTGVSGPFQWVGFFVAARPARVAWASGKSRALARFTPVSDTQTQDLTIDICQRNQLVHEGNEWLTK
jgi:hypothetical protein